MPNSARNAAVKISAETMSWIRKELPIRYAMSLLKIGMTAREIEDEVLRLKALPKNKRLPWQSHTSYTVNRFVTICKWGSIAVATIALIALLFRLYWYFFGIHATREPVTFEPYGHEFRDRDRFVKEK